MTTQIQTFCQLFCSHYLQNTRKLLTLAVVFLAIFGFGFQSIVIQAQTAAPTTAPTPAAPSKPTTNNATNLGTDTRIGALTQCTVGKATTVVNGAKTKTVITEAELKNKPTAANDFIFGCLKDIIQIVITISVILAVMQLMWTGIKFLNTFGDGAALNKELADKISGFLFGALLLGLFASILQVINPAALRIDKIFSPSVISDYKCLLNNKKESQSLTDVAFETDGKNVNSNSLRDCTKGNNAVGQGLGTANNLGTSAGTAGTAVSNTEIDKLLKGTDATEVQKLKDLLVKCNNSLAATDSAEVATCEKYQNYANSSNNYSEPSNVDETAQRFITGEKVANGDFVVKTIDPETSIVTVTYSTGSGKTVASFPQTLKLNGACEKSPFLLGQIGTKIARGQPMNYGTCKIEVSN
jgi:hypothetical protein